jgi:hypothetical protein
MYREYKNLEFLEGNASDFRGAAAAAWNAELSVCAIRSGRCRAVYASLSRFAAEESEWASSQMAWLVKR